MIDVPQALILARSPEDKDYLHARQAEARLRCSIVPFLGIVDAFAFAAGDQPLSYLSTPSAEGDPLPFCPPAANCDVYELLPVVNKLSVHRPMVFNVFVLLQLEPGTRRQWATEVALVAAAEEATGAYVAAAHLSGRGTYNAMLEVLSDDHNQYLELLLRCTDLTGVKMAHALFVDEHGTQGMGDS